MLSRIPCLLVLALVLAPVGCLDPIPDNTIRPGEGALEGKVLNGCDGTPVVGAEVSGGGKDVTTNGEGTYRLDGLSAGSVALRISHPDYRDELRTIQVIDGERRHIDLAIVPQTGGEDLLEQLDVLFVVDNSGSMEHEQAGLTGAFPQFIDALEHAFGDALPDLHIGVVSTDTGAGTHGLPSCEMATGDNGRLQSKPRKSGCTPPSDPWVAYTGGLSNVAAGTDHVTRVKDAFSCIAELGIGGCGFEQPLESMRRALDPGLNTNPGFLRDDAALAVIFVTDEDDCSAKDGALFDPSQQGLSDPLGPLTSFRCFEFGVVCDGDEDPRAPGVRSGCRPDPSAEYLHPVADYVTLLNELKTTPSTVFVGVLAGPSKPVAVGKNGENPILKASCQSVTGFAVPAIRLKAFADAFAPASLFSTICTKDLRQSMAAMAEKIVHTAMVDVCAVPQ